MNLAPRRGKTSKSEISLPKALGLKDKLATDGMLVKRPLVVLEDGRVLTGFREKEWAEALL